MNVESSDAGKQFSSFPLEHLSIVPILLSLHFGETTFPIVLICPIAMPGQLKIEKYQ